MLPADVGDGAGLSDGRDGSAGYCSAQHIGRLADTTGAPLFAALSVSVIGAAVLILSIKLLPREPLLDARHYLQHTIR
jgi:hypothetical protein